MRGEVRGEFKAKEGGVGDMHGKGQVCVAKLDMHDRGHAWQGACVAGGMYGKWGHASQGMCVVVWSMHGRRDGHCSGRYASYWNAFLFILICLLHDQVQSFRHTN